MRFFEIFIPIIMLVWLFLKDRVDHLDEQRAPMLVGLAAWLPTGILAVVGLHLFVEGYRWQMIMQYALAILFAVQSWWQLRRGKNRSQPRPLRWRVARGAGVLLLVLLAALIPALLPIPKLPVPHGPYQVGTVTLDFVDAEREDIYAPEPGQPRRLLVQIWYPADPVPGAQPAPWMDDAEIVAPAISTWIGMPPFFLEHLKYAVGHSIEDAPMSADQPVFPVIHFSHSWGGYRAQSTYLVEELASHGYVVVATEFTYEAITTVFPDGTVYRQNPDILPSGVSDSEYQKATDRLAHQLVEDIDFILDQLAALNEFDPGGRFTGRLDLDRIGFTGHSMGGGASIEYCAYSSRCKAGVGLDAWTGLLTADVIAQGPAQPFLFLYSELWESDKNRAKFERLVSGMPDQHPRLDILGTDHYDFSDLPALSPLAPMLGLKGPLDADRVLTIISENTLAFFDAALKDGDPVGLMGLDYPETVRWMP